ncbi:Di-trans-poly-cis-decaprenylcistransferase-like protein [Corchorus capsularis]|uniref:Alkyl transferase n=1 Tax=Corchorus capsularis TaxID=210143 RepID=A0A1R3H030_COCAP|nr:Di-trans-poly-cis-decaprenylcistransferase-like protein [Corchorus capsularis]
MDGNRRYARKKKLEIVGDGQDASFLAFLLMFIYCYEVGVKYVTAYAFSIDNVKRKPEEVQRLMDLMMRKIELLTTIVNNFEVRVHFAGNLELLSCDLRDATKELMEATLDYSKVVLTICIAYTSTDEMLHAIQQSCDKCKDGDVINLVDLERNMYMAMAPCPDIVIRTGGESRLSNFLLWQTSCSYLSTLVSLWPEISFRHLLWQ